MVNKTKFQLYETSALVGIFQRSAFMGIRNIKYLWVYNDTMRNSTLAVTDHCDLKYYELYLDSIYNIHITNYSYYE